MKKKNWFFVAIVCVAISVLSLFTTIISYIEPGGDVTHYSLPDLLFSSDFRVDVLADYSGPVLWKMGGATVSVLAFLAVAVLVCAIIGLITLRAQRPNHWNFVLTFIGLIGTAFPSFLVILAVILSNSFFPGTILCGIAPIVTPIAMLLCIRVVIRRKNKLQEQLRKELESQGMIRPAGDL